jgi:hypothetical protein
MKDTKLTSVGISMPPEFPAETYNKVHSCLIRYGNTHRSQLMWFSLGWNGLAYRYRALVDYDEEFTISVKISKSPPPEELYKQEKALFGFFVNALSTIECFFYSAHCMASILNPGAFPISRSKDLRFYAENVATRFNTNFPGDCLSVEMGLCLDEPTYKEMKDMRDVIAHRGGPPRKFYVGGDRNGMATMPKNIKDPSDQWQFDLPVDEKTTVSRRQWLDNMLNKLISAANDFCNRRL